MSHKTQPRSHQDGDPLVEPCCKMPADKLKDPATGVFHEYQARDAELFHGFLSNSCIWAAVTSNMIESSCDNKKFVGIFRMYAYYHECVRSKIIE